MRPCPSMKATRSPLRLACALRISKGDSSRHSPAARQRWASSGFSTVANCMRAPPIQTNAGRGLLRRDRCAKSGNDRLLGSGSALSPDRYDGAAMRALANLLVLVVCLDLEAELATVDLQQLGAHRELLALRRGAEVLDVDLKADGSVPFGQMCLHGLDARALHQADHGRGGEHALPSHVLDDKLVIDRRDDLGLEPWCEAVRCHGFSPVL